MNSATKKPASVYAKVGNLLLIGLLLLVLVSPNAKSWVLKQFVSIGLFKADLSQDKITKPANSSALNFSFVDENGRSVAVSDLKGKVVFINFWASWCPPCRAEMPSINAMYNKLKDDDRFVFLFVSEDDNFAAAKNYMQKNNFALPVFNSSGNIPAEVYNGTLPTTTILDKDGNIVMMHEGMANYNSEKFLKQLKALL
jgi:thiol-disulfide isomerase/thioredoxin